MAISTLQKNILLIITVVIAVAMSYFTPVGKEGILCAVLLLAVGQMVFSRREGWAAFFLAWSLSVSLYGLVGVVLFWFVRRRWRFALWMAIWCVVLMWGEWSYESYGVVALAVLMAAIFKGYKGKKRAARELQNEDIDVVLPCYNPRGEWVQTIAQQFTSLQECCPTHHMRLYVANDGSTANFEESHVELLRQMVPGVVIIDNKVNRGKGAALRSGVEQTTAPLVVYTDIDFPYEVKCTCKLIGRLCRGDANIVLAARNHTYHTELTPLRKLLSMVSRKLNYVVLGMEFSDAQGGLKGFDAKGRELFLQTKVERFLFDTEFIYQASRRQDIKLAQVVANLRQGIHLPPMSTQTMRREAINFLKIILR